MPRAFFRGLGPGTVSDRVPRPAVRPPTPQGSSSRRGPRTPPRRSLIVDIPTAGTASTALSADSALTAYSACAVTRVAVCSDSSPSVMSSLAPPAPAARARPGQGGRVRPAADGRAGPFQFQKELYCSSCNGTSPEGTRDSGRTFVLSGRNGPARPSAAGSTRLPGSLPSLASGRLGWNSAFLGLCTLCTLPVSLSPLRFAEPVCLQIAPRSACVLAALHHPPGHTGGGLPPGRR